MPLVRASARLQPGRPRWGLRRPALALVASAVLVGGVPGVAAGAPASATAPRATAQERDQLLDDLEAASVEEVRLAGQLAVAAAERDRLAALLVEVEARLAEAEDALEVADLLLGRANLELEAAQVRLRATERALRAGIAELQDQAVDAFIVGGHDEPIGVFMAAGDLRELAAASTYRDVVLERQDQIVATVERLEVERVEDERAAARAKGAATEAVVAADGRRDAVAGERSELKVLEATNAEAVLQHTRLLDEVQARKARYELELAALVQVSDSLAADLAARQAGQVVDPAAKGLLLVPVPSARLSSGFGPRIHPIFGTARMHAGLDLAAPTGTPTFAARAGTVVTAGVLGGYGNAVVVDHGGGLSTLYGHLSRIEVAPGQVVAQAQTIGLVGSTGNSTGPHLHFEARIFGTPVDPVAYL